MTTGPRNALVYICRIRLHNFRGIHDLDVRLEPDLTLLIGRNNIGKSRILRALAIATGGERTTVDDFTKGSRPGEDCFIDVEIAPLDDTGEPADFFLSVTSSAVGNHAQRVRREGTEGQGVAWRTRLIPSLEGSGPRKQTSLLVTTQPNGNWVEEHGKPVPKDIQSLVHSTLIQPGRDLADELHRRGTAANRLLKDLDITEEETAHLTNDLTALSTRIITASNRLSAITKTIEQLAATSDTVGSPSITALPGELSELSKYIDVTLAADNSRQKLPLRFHGSGSRSLTSIMIHGALYRHVLGADGGDLRPQPLTLVEEPEAHLHPTAQYDLAEQLKTLPGQVVATTHSSHIANVAPYKALRRLRRDHGKTAVYDLHPDGTDCQLADPWNLAEFERFTKLAERPFGELLFCDAIVVADGATERAMLPVVLRAALGTRSNGITVVHPGSMTNPNATTIVKLARRHSIPCFLFADDDKSGRSGLKNLLTLETDSFLITSATYGDAYDTEPYFVNKYPEVAREVCEFTGGSDKVTTEEMIDHLGEHKGWYGRYLGEMFVSHIENCLEDNDALMSPTSWPSPFQELIQWANEATSSGEHSTVSPLE